MAERDSSVKKINDLNADIRKRDATIRERDGSIETLRRRAENQGFGIKELKTRVAELFGRYAGMANLIRDVLHTNDSALSASLPDALLIKLRGAIEIWEEDPEARNVSCPQYEEEQPKQDDQEAVTPIDALISHLHLATTAAEAVEETLRTLEIEKEEFPGELQEKVESAIRSVFEGGS